jgi:hypothetical protein
VLSSRNLNIALVTGLILAASIAAYQKALLNAPARKAIPSTTTTTVMSFITVTSKGTSAATIADSTTTIGNQAIASTINYTLGLEITLTLNATHITVGQAIDAQLSYRNLLPRTLNLSSYAQDWRLVALGNDGDGYGYCPGRSPFAIEIFGGYFTAGNITLQSPLNADGNAVEGALASCNLAISDYRVFPPLASGIGLVNVANGSSSNGYLRAFAPILYTVAAGDRWGQMVILHFAVEQANP